MSDLARAAKEKTSSDQQGPAGLRRVVDPVVTRPGRPLDPGVRAEMEPRLSHDFGRVRVHDDADAALSAAAVRADAYAVGDHVVFGAGRYRPATAQGRRLIAHELAHVVQHAGGSGSLDTLSVEPAHSPAEHEAAAAADAVVAGEPAPPITTHRADRALRRSVLGDIAGAGLGALAGAGLGFLVGGPVGAVVGGLLGGLAGLIAGETLSADVRPLNDNERREAHLVFGDNLDYDRVRLGESAIMGAGENARTPFETIYFPPGAQASPNFIPWLIHEMTHVWQTQHGISVLTKIWWALHAITGNPYDYGGEAGLVRAAAQGKHFRDFNTEQQGDICRDYYNALKAHRDTSAYEPFMREVKGLPAQSGPGPGPGDFPTTTSAMA